MDDKSKNQLGGGAIGGALGAAAGGPAGAVVGATVGGWLFGRESDHNDTLRKTYSAVKEATSDDAHLYVSHIDPDGAAPTSPQGVIDGVDGEPDIISIDSTSANLIVEVETMEAIAENGSHALNQLQDYRTSGFKRVLVVPEEEIDAAIEWVEAHEDQGALEGSLTVASPERIANVL
jgi:hypothetical protein